MTKEEKQLTDEEKERAEEYFKKGNKVRKQGEYYRAIVLYGKALEIVPYNPAVLNNMGLSYHQLGKYKEAIVCYEDAPKNNSYEKSILYNKGNAYFELKDYVKAINCYDQITKVDDNYIYTLTKKGEAYLCLGDYNRAQYYFKNATDIDEKNKYAWAGRALSLLILLVNDKNKNKESYQEIGYCLIKGHVEIVGLIINMDLLEIDNDFSHLVFKAMLNGDKHFKNTVGKSSGSKLEAYKDIYVKSLQIVAMLHVDLKKYEGSVAHYTRRGIAELMIVTQSPFRLSAVTTANDPSEGKTLLDYLGIKEDDTSNYQAFAGSFIFNPDCLNQFRLYGKEDGREATGVSITVGDGFFSEVAGINKGLQMSDTIDKKEEKKEQAKESLYRCIYIDPVTNRVVSVGHKEDYVFYREDAYIEEKVIGSYKKYIAQVQKDVTVALASLKEDIGKLKKSLRTKKDRERAEKILSGLLIHLRYLVKHVAFREEQECRIIKVEKIGKSNKNIKIDAGGSRMYCETIKMRDEKECHISDIHFGPKASGKELFENILKHLDLKSEISLHQSDHPFFN